MAANHMMGRLTLLRHFNRPDYICQVTVHKKYQLRPRNKYRSEGKPALSLSSSLESVASNQNHAATMSETVIRAINSSITIFSVPFSRFGILPIGGRSTAIKLKNDEVFVLASSPADKETIATINAMGTVK